MKLKHIVLTIFFFAILIISAESTAPKMYWTDRDGGRIQRANLDGSNIETIVHTRYPHGIAIDLSKEKMYWIDWPAVSISSVKRANLDGTEIETLVSGLHIPQDIALDISRFQMYWVDHGGGIDKIYRANMDGTNTEVIVYGAEARGIALDLENNKIYWTRVQGGGVGSRSIKRANLNGTNVETVVGGLGTPDDIALDLEHGKIYWTDQYTHKVQRANLNGTNIEDLVVMGLDRPYGIALDLLNRKMYWVDWGTKKIQRANMDGTKIEDLVTSGLDQPLYITLLPEQPSNAPPIAHAGEDQTVYTWIDNLAEVTLDGTGSYDSDGDELEYFWYNDTNELMATGAEPNVLFGVGQYEVTLIVNDGTEDSEPDSCIVTVLPAIQMEAKLIPQTLNRKSNRPHVIGRLELAGVSVDDLDPNEPMVLMPGNIEAYRMDILPAKGKKGSTILKGFFDNAALMNATVDDIPIPDTDDSGLTDTTLLQERSFGRIENGKYKVAIAAKLLSGQWVYGSDIVTIIDKGKGSNDDIPVPDDPGDDDIPVPGDYDIPIPGGDEIG